jgi:hypothetical protein
MAYEYQPLEHAITYTPIHKLEFSEGKAVVFHQESTPTEIRYAPWEIKETTLKNFLGVGGFVVIDYLFAPGNMVYSLGVLYFTFNWLYRMYAFLGNAITKIELNEDGKTVTCHFKTGGKTTIKIHEIMKRQHEKELVQTFEEGFLFPI